MKKIQISESDLYEIIKQVLLEQKEKEEKIKVWETNNQEFNYRLFRLLNGDSEKFAKYLNIKYDNIVVNDILDLSGTQITTLPDNLHITWGLYLDNCKNLTSLPDNLYVEGYMTLNETSITSLPDNLVVEGTIYIHKTPLNQNDELVKEYIAKGYDIDRIN